MSAQRVSVLIASRDGERHLDQALASIASQTWPHVEVIAVDDGSTDRTRAILDSFAARHPRATVLATAGVGLAAALRLAAAQSTGELIARHDDDDRSHPERFERQVRAMEARPGLAVLGTGARVIDDAGAVLREYPVPVGDALRRALRRAPPFVHGSVMMRREAYERAGGYRAAFGAAQDFDLWLRMPADAELHNLAEPLYEWRLHARGVFTRARDRQLFFAAVARAFTDERAATGRDSIELLDPHAAPVEFYHRHPWRDRFARYFGEAYVREGRPAAARPWLARAMSHPRSAAAGFAWWLASFPAALAPRARRARAARTSAADDPEARATAGAGR